MSFTRAPSKGATWDLPPPKDMSLPPPPAQMGGAPLPPGASAPVDQHLQRVNSTSRAQNRLSTPLPLRFGGFKSSAVNTSAPLFSPPATASHNGSSAPSATAASPDVSPSGVKRGESPRGVLHSSGDAALAGNYSTARAARFASSRALLESVEMTAPNTPHATSPSSSPASSSPNASKRKSMLVNPFSRSPSTSPKTSSDSHPVSPSHVSLGSSASASSPLNSPKNRKTVVIAPTSSSSFSPSASSSFSPSSSSSFSPSVSSFSPSGGYSSSSPRQVESPRKNVQLLNISGGGGGGVIKEMSASLLKTLLGGDNAKYPVILDFSKGYLLNNDYFLASCPDIIKEINLSHNQLTECNSLSHMSKLKHLFLDNNKVSDISFEGLVSLKVLSLMGNELEYLTSMSDLDKLEHLNLAGNKLIAGFHELSKLKSLQSLNLSNNNFNFTLRKFYSFLLVPLKKHTKLHSLSIGRGNPVASSIPHFRLWVIHELPQLKTLDERPIDRVEVEEAAQLDATGQWADKDGDRLEKKGNWSAPAEASGRVVASHLNIGTPPVQAVSAPELEPEKKKVVVRRADLNVGGGGGDEDTPASPSMGTGDTPKVVVRRMDLNVSLSASNSSDELPGGEGGSGRKRKDKKEKKEKGKKEKEKKGSAINHKRISGGQVRSRAGSESDDRDKWPTDPSVLAKIASTLTIQPPPESPSLTTAKRLSQQLTASQAQFVGSGTAAAELAEAVAHEGEGTLETRIDYLRSFFLLDELSSTVCRFAQAAATPAWGPAEFVQLNTQLKQLVVHTKLMYERVQQFLGRYPFEEKRITEAMVLVQNYVRGLVIAVKQLNEAQARGGTVATAISATKELVLALFRMFLIVEEGVIPSTDETAADIQECARGVMKLIQIATGMSRELSIDQHSDLLLQQSERLSHQLNMKIPMLQNPEVQRRAEISTASINGSITKLIALSKQYLTSPEPLLLQEIRQTAQTIATEFQSINTMIHTSRFASPLNPYDERVMYETSYQLLVDENQYVGIHEEAMLPNERLVLNHMKSLMRLAGEIKGVVALKPISTPQLTQLVLDMSSVGAATCHQLYVTAANYSDRATREQLERYGRAIRYYSFFERVALCSLVLNFAAPDVLHLSTTMRGQTFCTANVVKMILLSALTQAPQVLGAPKRHSGVNFDDLLSMLP